MKTDPGAFAHSRKSFLRPRPSHTQAQASSKERSAEDGACNQ